MADRSLSNQDGVGVGRGGCAHEWVESRGSWRQELTHRGEPEPQERRQGQPEMPAPQLHSKGSRESSLPASVSGCVC